MLHRLSTRRAYPKHRIIIRQCKIEYSKCNHETEKYKEQLIKERCTEVAVFEMLILKEID